MDAFCPYKASAEANPMLSTNDMGRMTNLSQSETFFPPKRLIFRRFWVAALYG